MLLARIMSKEEYRVFQENGIVEPTKELWSIRIWDKRNARGKEGDYTFMALNNLKNIACNYRSIIRWFAIRWNMELELELSKKIKDKYEDEGIDSSGLCLVDTNKELYKDLIEQGYEIGTEFFIKYNSNYEPESVISKFSYLWEKYGKEKEDNLLVFFESSSVTDDMIYEGAYNGLVRIDDYDPEGEYGIDKSAEIAVPNYSQKDYRVIYATQVNGYTVCDQFIENIVRFKLTDQCLHKNKGESKLYEDLLKWISENYFQYIEENRFEKEEETKEKFVKFIHTQSNPFEGKKDENEKEMQFPLYEEMLIKLSIYGDNYEEQKKEITDILYNYLDARFYKKAHNKYFYDDLGIQNMDEEIEKFLYILKSRKIVDEQNFIRIAGAYYQTLNNWEYEDMRDEYYYDDEYYEYDSEEDNEQVEITEQDISKTILDSTIDREKGKEILDELIKENQVKKE